MNVWLKRCNSFGRKTNGFVLIFRKLIIFLVESNGQCWSQSQQFFICNPGCLIKSSFIVHINVNDDIWQFQPKRKDALNMKSKFIQCSIFISFSMFNLYFDGNITFKNFYFMTGTFLWWSLLINIEKPLKLDQFSHIELLKFCKKKKNFLYIYYIMSCKI